MTKGLFEAKEAIFTPVPVWPALDWRVGLGLTLAIIGLGKWIHIVPRRLIPI